MENLKAASPFSRLEEEVWAGLSAVTDPELDESVTEMKFVSDVTVDSENHVCIGFRLPTFWCSANFAYLMAEDMRLATLALPWVRGVRVELRDHMYGAEISEGVSSGASFKDIFGKEASSEGDRLERLRSKFRRKAFQRRQETALRLLLAQGLSAEQLIAMDMATFDALTMTSGKDARRIARYREIRAELGGPSGSSDPVFTTVEGDRLTLENFSSYLRDLRNTRMSLEFNGTFCRGLLRARYGDAIPGPDEIAPAAAPFADTQQS